MALWQLSWATGIMYLVRDVGHHVALWQLSWAIMYLVRDVGHHVVRGRLPHQGQQDTLAALAGQHLAVAAGVLGAHVVDGPHRPQLHRLLLGYGSYNYSLMFNN